MTKKAFLGIDISMATLDFALMFEDHLQKYQYLKTKNELGGFEEMLTWLKEKKVDLGNLTIVLEHTGVYTLGLLLFLEERNIPYCIVPGLEIKLSLGIQRGKNDKVDASRIAYYGFLFRHKLTSSQLPSRQLIALKQWLTTRALWVKHRKSVSNSLKSHQKLNQATENDLVAEMLANQIKALDKDIKRAEKEMKAIVLDKQDIKENYKLLISITGIGDIIAYALIVSTNNFTSFSNAREYMSYIGVAPFEKESGKYRGKKRVCKLANIKLKALMHNGVNSAIAHDPETQAYYLRKLEQGKQKRQAKNGIVGKLILRAFAVINRGTPFVALYSQKIIAKKVA